MTYTRKVVAVGFTVAAVAMAGACGSGSTTNPGLNQAPSSVATSPSTAASSSAAASSSSTSAPTAADPTAQAKADALTAYSGMVKAMTEELDSGKLNPDVLKYADGAAYDKITTGLNTAHDGRFVYVGKPQSSPKATAVDLSAKPQTVTISDCFGGPSWGAVFVADDKDGHKKGQSAGSPTPPAPLSATVENLFGSWKVTAYTLNLDATC